MSRNLEKATGRKSQADCFTVSVDGVDTCPCCNRLLTHDNTRRHHVREHIEGGLSIRWNVIAICASCHVTIHGGTEEDMYTLNTKAKNALIARYGLLSLLQYPVWREWLRMVCPSTITQVRAINNEIKSVFAGIKPMKYEDALVVNLSEAMFWGARVTQDKFAIESI